MTMGASLLATGARKSGASEMIPIKSISSVTKVRDGIRFSAIRVIVTGNTIDFRVSHGEAEPIKETITKLILGSHPAQAKPTPVDPPSTPAPGTVGIAEELTKLVGLRDSGILTAEQFETAKTKLLA